MKEANNEHGFAQKVMAMDWRWFLDKKNFIQKNQY